MPLVLNARIAAGTEVTSHQQTREHGFGNILDFQGGSLLVHVLGLAVVCLGVMFNLFVLLYSPKELL